MTNRSSRLIKSGVSIICVSKWDHVNGEAGFLIPSAHADGTDVSLPESQCRKDAQKKNR